MSVVTRAQVTGDTAPLGRTLGLVRPVRGRLALAAVLGAGAIAADIGLIGTAVWLISRAAQHPNESHLAVAIVGVQFFGLSRGFLRYEERLVGHDAAFRLLAELRVKVYERLERLAPTGLPAFRRGDLLARLVQDVDSLQDLAIRVIPSFAIVLMVGALTVAIMWLMLPAAGVILGVALALASTVVPWLTATLARRRESRFARLRGDLGAAMVDLVEGASELIVFGAADEQVRTIRGQDSELTAIDSMSARTVGVGLGLTTLLAGLASWGCLMAGIPAVASGRLDGTELAVITLIPLAVFELVAGLPVATQALQRVRQAAARVLEVSDAPVPVADPEEPADLPDSPYDLQAGSLRARYPHAATPALCGIDLALPPVGAWPSWAQRSRQVDPGGGPARIPALRGRVGGTGRHTPRPPRRRRPPNRRGARRPRRLPVRHDHRREPAGRVPPRIRCRAAPRPRASRAGRLARQSPAWTGHRRREARCAPLRWPAPADRSRPGPAGGVP